MDPQSEKSEQPSGEYPPLPNIFESTRIINDPVREQKRKEQREKSKKKEQPVKKDSGTIHIRPSLGTRLDLLHRPISKKEEGKLVKYLLPKSKKQIKEEKERRKKFEEEINFCKYDVIRIPSTSVERKIDIKVDVPSPGTSSAKVFPKKASVTPSDLYPDPQTKEELNLSKPKSGIIINESKGKDSKQDYDSFDLVYTRHARPNSIISYKKGSRRHKSGRKHERKKKSSGVDTGEDEGAEGDKSKKHKKRKSGSKPKSKELTPEVGIEEEDEKNLLSKILEVEEEMLAAEMEEGGGDAIPEMEDYLTKQFRRKVSQISKGTSYQSRDLRSESGEGDEEVNELPVNRLVQKYIYPATEQKMRKIKRGTLESHSFTKIKQPTLKSFYFGSKCGSMHQGDQHFPESTRNKQGICMSIAAYCYSLLVHPNNWTSESIDAILEAGNELYTDCSKNLHIHEVKRELSPEDLEKFCYIGNKKIRFNVSEPEVTGMIRSEDKTVYNLTKGLKIFFHRNRAGIFKTKGVSITLWRDKHFYFFDALPRTKDLFPDSEGFATMGNFYDIMSVTTVLLERSNLGNWPFIIYPLEGYKIYDKDELVVADSDIGISVRSNYNILDDKRAVVVGSFDLADKCFDFTRKKQALAMAVICLVYSRITPPSAWQRRTLDKILTIGNQLYLECVEAASITELVLENLPAVFTMGPYLIDIFIYTNRCTDLMYRKGKCQFMLGMEAFLAKNNNAIVQIGKHTLAIWKQRNMFYCFDPYSRNNEGVKCRDGGACVSMHATLESLVDLVATNFEGKDNIFRIHSLKVCKIHRDPAQGSLFPKNMTMGDYPVEDFKKYKMVKSMRAATEKPVTVDYTYTASTQLPYGVSPAPSLVEIGSKVESLLMNQIPPLPTKHPHRTIPQITLNEKHLVFDLDSPSLSDTQIEPPPLLPIPSDEDLGLKHLDSFDMTIEEQCIFAPDGEEDAEQGEKEQPEGAEEEAELEDEMERMAEEGAEEGPEDWYMAMANFTQVGSGSIMRSKISIDINTELTYSPIPKEIVQPTRIAGRQEMMKRVEMTKQDSWFDIGMVEDPKVTQSEELRKESNFVDLPDDTQLLRGTQHMAQFGGDLEFMAPFVCIMAIAVAKKYSIISWSSEIVDYVLTCGSELYKASKVRYDQVSRLEIPKIALGRTNFSIRVSYLFDTYMKQNIVELALDKILFARSDSGILVTPTYACAIFHKNHLFYLYDGFGNNEVGLSMGAQNKGTACFARFKSVHSLTTRIMYNKSKRESDELIEYTRFVISICQVKQVKEDKELKKRQKKKARRDGIKEAEEEYEKMAEQQGEFEDDYGDTKKDKKGAEEGEDRGADDGDAASQKKEPDNKVGYQYSRNVCTIAGTKGLAERATISGLLKEDHFVCLCASLMLMSCPVNKWDTKRVDKVVEQGKHVFSHADDLDISEKRIIKNILIDKNYFDIIVKRIKIANWKDNKNFKKGIDTLLGKKHNYFLIQFPNCCFVLHKTGEDRFHLFDPYGCTKSGKPTKTGGKATWIRFNNLKKLKKYLMQSLIERGEGYQFYNFEVSSITKAPKKVLLERKLQMYEVAKPKKQEVIEKPFHEDIIWLEMDPIPWSRRTNTTPEGAYRDGDEEKWHDWCIEYSKDLFSLTGNLHQSGDDFPPETRGKQTLANLVVAIGMLDIYNLSEWTAAIIDSVLVNGDNYLQTCIKDIKDEDYELAMDDLLEECSIFPYSFKVSYNPVVHGTMFLMRLKQFNLYKALRYFFDGYESRFGIIIRSKSERKRAVAFGKVKSSEYFMFDSQAFGSPMFVDHSGVAYILRMTTLNRLLHVLTLTLRGGDFFIYELEITDFQPIS